MSIREEVELYTKLSGEDGSQETIATIGAYLRGYRQGKEDAEPHWIPVEQALPELRHDVLLTVFFHERWNVAEGYRQDGEFMFWNNGRLDPVLDEENRVIAWMPKPEPYKPTVPPECEGDCGWCKPSVIEKCKGVTE